MGLLKRFAKDLAIRIKWLCRARGDALKPAIGSLFFTAEGLGALTRNIIGNSSYMLKLK